MHVGIFILTAQLVFRSTVSTSSLLSPSKSLKIINPYISFICNNTNTPKEIEKSPEKMTKRIVDFFTTAQKATANKLQKQKTVSPTRPQATLNHMHSFDNIEKLLGEEWAMHLTSEFRKQYFTDLWSRVTKARSSNTVYPPPELVFNAFKIVPLSRVKVVIIGQDPYHQPRQAMGLSFSVPRGVAIPPSLRNIFAEAGVYSRHGDLTSWAEQGVFMLNCILTVVHGQPLAHKDFGWDTFTDKVVEIINKECENVVFLLWGNAKVVEMNSLGNPAKQKCANINTKRHCILTAGHPSPLSIKYFKGCDHFTKCNEYLMRTKQTPINWQLPL